MRRATSFSFASSPRIRNSTGTPQLRSSKVWVAEGDCGGGAIMRATPQSVASRWPDACSSRAVRVSTCRISQNTKPRAQRFFRRWPRVAVPNSMAPSPAASSTKTRLITKAKMPVAATSRLSRSRWIKPSSNAAISATISTARPATAASATAWAWWCSAVSSSRLLIILIGYAMHRSAISIDVITNGYGAMLNYVAADSGARPLGDRRLYPRAAVQPERQRERSAAGSARAAPARGPGGNPEMKNAMQAEPMARPDTDFNNFPAQPATPAGCARRVRRRCCSGSVTAKSQPEKK